MTRDIFNDEKRVLEIRRPRAHKISINKKILS